MDDLSCGMDEGRGKELLQGDQYGQTVLFRDIEHYSKEGHENSGRTGLFHGIQNAAIFAGKLSLTLCRGNIGDTEKRYIKIFIGCKGRYILL